jgi:nucleoside-diphosphate-sugar epimerase
MNAQMREGAVLVTGATGFIGRYVVARLLLSDRPVILAARRSAGASARERIFRIFGSLAERLARIVEMDLTELSSLEDEFRCLRSDIGTVIYCAGETSFFPDSMAAARAVQIDVPLALIDLLQARGLRCWAHVSTAFVCGQRSGVIYEEEGDAGQTFHNPYEVIKLESERQVAQRCRILGLDCKIFRPSVVVGAAPATGGGKPSNLFLRFVWSLTSAASLAGSRTIRIQGRPDARFQIVPIEYVAAAIVKITDCPASSGTYHLVASNPPTQTDFLNMLTRHLGVGGARVTDDATLSNSSPLEARLARMLAPYREYLIHDVVFDDACARKRLDGSGILAPRIDAAEIARLVRLALPCPARTKRLRAEAAVLVN